MTKENQERCCVKCMPGNPAWMACVNSTCPCHQQNQENHDISKATATTIRCTCAMKPVNCKVHDNQESWEKEFDRAFYRDTSGERVDGYLLRDNFDGTVSIAIPENVKSFIVRLLEKEFERAWVEFRDRELPKEIELALSNQKSSLVEKMEKLRVYSNDEGGDWTSLDMLHKDDVLSLLKEIK